VKTLTTIFFNILIIALLLLFVEIFFGGWLDKNNLGAYFREHRMKKVDYSIKYKNEILNYTYKRNYHGFRGEAIKPKNIKAVFIGGSTADERWKPAKLSIVELLNKKLQADKIDLKIINAGIEGQSTTGYIANFKFWFSKLEDFKPDYFIFYTGINELNKQDFNVFDYSDGQAKLIDKNKKNVFFDNLKSKSFFYDSLRKIKHKYYTRDVAKTIFMDIDNQILKIKPPAKYGLKNYKYITFNESLKRNNISELLNEEDKFIKGYLNNIDIIKNYVDSFSAKAIFINQVTAFGGFSKRHLALNYSLINHCNVKNYTCIDFAGEFKGKKEYWYDLNHTTPLGSQVISDVIYPKIKEIVKN
jgi:lysophospholipase L1-like esterase